MFNNPTVAALVSRYQEALYDHDHELARAVAKQLGYLLEVLYRMNKSADRWRKSFLSCYNDYTS